MRLSSIAAMAGMMFWLGVGDALAAPVELVCTYQSTDTHLYIDVDAATAVWFNQTFKAQITDTQVHWSGIMVTVLPDRGPQIDATFDRDTGTLVVTLQAGSDPDTGRSWGGGTTTYACTKAQKIL